MPKNYPTVVDREDSAVDDGKTVNAVGEIIEGSELKLGAQKYGLTATFRFTVPLTAIFCDI